MWSQRCRNVHSIVGYDEHIRTVGSTSLKCLMVKVSIRVTKEPMRWYLLCLLFVVG